MKKILLFSICLLAFAFTENKAQAYRPDRMFNYFYQSLNPYGEWIEIDYDLYAWRPSYVRYNWTPYRDGRWIWTNYGWYWDSYEPYGWAVYHYGRWIYDDYYGWIWMPDNEWGPAWVEWRYNDNYIGWSPLPPYASFSVNAGIHFSVTWNAPHTYWTFVDVHHFHGVHISRYVVKDDVRYRIFSKTKYRTNYGYTSGRIVNNGIDRNLVERRSGSKIMQRDVRYTSETKARDGGRSSGSTRSVSAYRPAESDLTRYEGRTEVKATRSDRKSSVQVDRIENNIYRERTSTRDASNGAARSSNPAATGTTTRERTDNSGNNGTTTVPQRTSGTERGGSETRTSGSERTGSPARTTGTENANPASRGGEVERGNAGTSNRGSVENSGRTSRERASQPAATTAPAQRTSAPQDVKKSSPATETRSSGTGTNATRGGNSDNSSSKTRGNSGRSGR